MNKIIRLALVVSMALAGTGKANAQLSNILKSAASNVVSSTVSSATGSSTTGSLVSSLLGNVLGTNKVSETSIAGTWTYQEPCVVAESDNILSNLAATAAANKSASYLKKGLTKIGFTKGKVILTLNSDKTAGITIKGKTINGTWSVSGSDLTLTNTLTGKSVTMNVSLDSGNLQVAVSADKLLTLLQTFGSSATSISSTLGTVTKLLNKVDGLYIGLKFSQE